jgi:hypothetical protein
VGNTTNALGGVVLDRDLAPATAKVRHPDYRHGMSTNCHFNVLFSVDPSSYFAYILCQNVFRGERQIVTHVSVFVFPPSIPLSCWSTIIVPDPATICPICCCLHFGYC